MVRRAAVAFALIGFIVPAAAQQRDRASIPEKYKWDLTPIYASNAAWRAAKEQLAGELPGIRQLKGTLAARGRAASARTATRAQDFTTGSPPTPTSERRIQRVAEHQGMRQEARYWARLSARRRIHGTGDSQMAARSCVSQSAERAWPRTVSS